MNKVIRLVVIILVSAGAGIAVWALLRFTAPKHQSEAATNPPNPGGAIDSEQWARAVERVKEARSEAENAKGGSAVPPELRHYEDRHWFLATQVAEVTKHNLHSVQDFVDLASMLERRELVPVPAVTDTYVLFGVGAKAKDEPFTRYEANQSVGVYDEAQLRDAYARIEATRTNLQSVIAKLKAQAGTLKKGAQPRDLQKQIAAREQELKSADEEKALLDQIYGQPESRQRLFSDYASLQSLAKNFNGRSYDLNNPADREAMKLSMLGSLRPEALKVLKEIAADYHRGFDRPLPVSSLVRPEEYQHVLRKFNRNAVLIDTPPHSTGLAFDIDYRYMSAAEQSFLMTELARLKKDGRIEVIRERNANYHVFAFIDGVRPSDELITASLDAAGAPPKEADQPEEKPAQTKRKSPPAKESKARKKRR
jgi:hypothetical protein